MRLFISLCLYLFSQLTFAGDIYTGWFSNTAIKGYDPVAYFELSQARKGDPAYSFDWQGVTWHFVSKRHQELFAAAPANYAPQYGGYCAYAMAVNAERVKVAPRIWSIVDGKLYLNYSEKIQRVWNAKRAEYIQAADRNWKAHQAE